MKFIKKIMALTILLLVGMMFTNNVSAANATFKFNPSTSTVVVGNNVTVTVTLSSGTALGSWNFTIGYDTNKLRLVSSTAERDQTSVGVVTKANQKSVSYNYTFKALSSGSASIYIQSASVYDYSEQSMSITKGSSNLTLKTWAQIEAGYSKNADLKSISIDAGKLNPDAKLSPEFNKDTLEYTIELEPDTTEITVNASKDDSTASVNGTGKIAVSEGSNKIEIVVTAQKGNTKTYVINAIVKELEPIVVTVNGKEYTVIRKVENMVKPYSYTEDTVMINEIEVPAFYSSITGYKLVGLKDEQGIVKLFVYDEEKDTFNYYQELSLNKVILATVLVPEDKIIKGYIKDTITINNEEVECIKNNEFGITLVYGKNVETGKTLFYVYDEDENTLQRYNDDTFNKINKKFEIYAYVILGSLGFIVLLIIILISTIISNKKRLKLRKEEMKNSLLSDENKDMATLEMSSKQDKKIREKELRQKQKELEELERKTKEKLAEQERLKEKEKRKHQKKESKKNKKDKKQEIEVKQIKKENIELQEFELETKNENNSKKKKNSKKIDDDDDMFLL